MLHLHVYDTCAFTVQEEEPNDRKIGKLCEYAVKNPFRIPKVYSFPVSVIKSNETRTLSANMLHKILFTSRLKSEISITFLSLTFWIC